MTSQIEEQILAAIEYNGGEIIGTESLAHELQVAKWWTVRCARRVASQGKILIQESTGGRGNKTRYLCTRARCITCGHGKTCPILKKHPRFNQPRKVTR